MVPVLGISVAVANSDSLEKPHIRFIFSQEINKRFARFCRHLINLILPDQLSGLKYVMNDSDLDRLCLRRLSRGSGKKVYLIEFP